MNDQVRESVSTNLRRVQTTLARLLELPEASMPELLKQAEVVLPAELVEEIEGIWRDAETRQGFLSESPSGKTTTGEDFDHRCTRLIFRLQRAIRPAEAVSSESGGSTKRSTASASNPTSALRLLSHRLRTEPRTRAALVLVLFLLAGYIAATVKNARVAAGGVHGREPAAASAAPTATEGAHSVAGAASSIYAKISGAVERSTKPFAGPDLASTAASSPIISTTAAQQAAGGTQAAGFQISSTTLKQAKAWLAENLVPYRETANAVFRGTILTSNVSGRINIQDLSTLVLIFDADEHLVGIEMTFAYRAGGTQQLVQLARRYESVLLHLSKKYRLAEGSDGSAQVNNADGTAALSRMLRGEDLRVRYTSADAAISVESTAPFQALTVTYSRKDVDSLLQSSARAKAEEQRRAESKLF